MVPVLNKLRPRCGGKTLDVLDVFFSGVPPEKSLRLLPAKVADENWFALLINPTNTPASFPGAKLEYVGIVR
jgi:hypothetical protein